MSIPSFIEAADGGLWRCSCCGEIRDNNLDSSWRWNGEIWEHKCPGNHPQHGHEPARHFGSDSTTRVRELEDAITEAGIILAEAEVNEVPHQTIKRAMQRLGSVMNDPAVLKRQGI